MFTEPTMLLADGPITAADLQRSPKWGKFARDWLRDHPECIFCGQTNRNLLTPHHIEPFHINPARELDLTNICTACETPGLTCHLFCGHLGRWDWWQKDVETTAKKLRSRRTALRKWLELEQRRFLAKK